MNKYFVNLTNGLDYLDYLKGLDRYVNFIRIQSTHFEQGLHEIALVDLDNNFLMSLAIGCKCNILDMTSRYGGRRPSRAIWQGVEWIKYALNRAWFDREIECLYGQHIHFKTVYSKLQKRTKAKLKYYRKFLRVEELDINCFCGETKNDGDHEYYKELVEKWITRN